MFWLIVPITYPNFDFSLSLSLSCSLALRNCGWTQQIQKKKNVYNVKREIQSSTVIEKPCHSIYDKDISWCFPFACSENQMFLLRILCSRLCVNIHTEFQRATPPYNTTNPIKPASTKRVREFIPSQATAKPRHPQFAKCQTFSSRSPQLSHEPPFSLSLTLPISI